MESVADTELTLYGSNGKRFLSVEQIEAERAELEEGLKLERLGREQASRRADEAMARANEAEERNAKLLSALKAAGIEAPA